MNEENGFISDIEPDMNVPEPEFLSADGSVRDPLQHDADMEAFPKDPLMDQTASDAAISFGANPIALQVAADASEAADFFHGTFLEPLFDKLAEGLSNSNMPGMELIKEHVDKIADFYGVDTVKVFYEKGEPGVQYSGMTPRNYDNWIGGDPEILEKYSKFYGPDFAETTIAHEFGHNMYSRLGGDETSRIGHEAFADYSAGLYAGAQGLSPDGMVAFLNEFPGDGVLYPENRSELFMEGYQDAQDYQWKDFQTIVDDQTFDLQDKMQEIAGRYT